jgi:hypothetical protein
MAEEGGWSFPRAEVAVLMAIATFFIFTVPPLNQPLVKLAEPFVQPSAELPKEEAVLPLEEVLEMPEVTPTYEGVTFSWTPVRAGITVAQIAQGRGVTCPIEFSGLPADFTGPVRLEIKDPKIAEMGVSLDEAEVKDGKIKSAVTFSLAPGGPVGSKRVVIVAKDDRGNVIGEGTIFFLALPPGAGGC